MSRPDPVFLATAAEIVLRAVADTAFDVAVLIANGAAPLFGAEHLAVLIDCALPFSAHHIAILVLDAISGGVGRRGGNQKQATNDK